MTDKDIVQKLADDLGCMIEPDPAVWIAQAAALIQSSFEAWGKAEALAWAEQYLDAEEIEAGFAEDIQDA